MSAKHPRGLARSTHSDGEVLLVGLLLVEDVLGLADRVENVGLAVLITLGSALLSDACTGCTAAAGNQTHVGACIR